MDACTVRYTLTVYVDRPIAADDDTAYYLSQRTRHELEREVIQVLRRLDGDCDCEVMTAEILAEGVRS